MDNIELNIFDDTSDEIVLPGGEVKLDDVEISESDIANKLKSTVDIISKGVDEAISGEIVKSMIIPEDNSMILPNYVIDLTSIDDIETIQAMALDALLNDDGDIAIYICAKDGINKAGMGYSDVLNRILVQSMSNVFNNKCVIYRNYTPNGELDIVDGRDVSHLRLSI